MDWLSFCFVHIEFASIKMVKLGSLFLCSILSYVLMRLTVPKQFEIDSIIKAFNKDLESYCVEIKDHPNGPAKVRPVICCVCDGIPDVANWSEWVDIDRFQNLCKKANLGKKRLLDRKVYPAQLINQYTAPDVDRLKDYVLSPCSIINKSKDEILACKTCTKAMEENSTLRNLIKFRKPPQQSIANGFLVGEAPDELTSLNEVELTLVSQVKIHMQCWAYFGGCHKQVRGWHTFFRNRPEANVADLGRLESSGIKGNVMVILCGPFTTTQRAMVMEATKVRPAKVIAAYEWLKQNNFHYKDKVIPSADELPKVQIITENV